MLLGASSLRAEIDYRRIVSIVGERGAGKDLLSHELAIPYLDRGYLYYSNQFSVWNDPLYVKLEGQTEINAIKGITEHIEYKNGQAYIKRRGEVAMVSDNLLPIIRRRVVVLSEAGKYLREYKYFEDLLEYARKMKLYFFFPSVRESHADLMSLCIYPIFPFKPVFGFDGGVWGWWLDTGYRKKKRGVFIFLPKRELIGVYDTSDYTENPNVLLECVRKEITLDQITRGRNGLQAVEGIATGVDADHQTAIARRAEQLALSLSYKNRK